MRAIDTNVLVRILTRDEPAQTKAADRFVADRVWISHLVLVETVWVLRTVYQKSPEKLVEAVEDLLRHEHLVLQDPDVVTAALKIYARKPSLGFADCMVLEIARKAGHQPLGTFDRSLSKTTDAHLIMARPK